MSGEMVASWIWGISIGAAVSGIFLSWALKVPVITAWSAPGTALLVTLFPAITLNQVVGAYITAAVIIFLIGVSGVLYRIMRRIPPGIAAGMMAGILFQFGVNAFKSATTMPALTFGMVAGLRRLPAVGAALLLSCWYWCPASPWRCCWVTPMSAALSWTLTTPTFITPEWTWGTTLSLALPLVLVSLTGQFLPGMAILHLSGYRTPARPIIAATSLASLGVAVFGGITIVVAAITAALCTGKDFARRSGQMLCRGHRQRRLLSDRRDLCRHDRDDVHRPAEGVHRRPRRACPARRHRRQCHNGSA